MGEHPPVKQAQKQELSSLLRSTGLWRASSIDCDGQSETSRTPTGYPALDAELPGGGWPAAGLSELLHDHQGIGEFRLLMHGLSYLSRQQHRWLLIVSPPYIPYPPALQQAGIDLKRVVVTTPTTTRDYLWVLEKALGSGSCSAVIAWPDRVDRIRDKSLRRLQVAGKAGNCWGILFRPSRMAANPSPAELRIALEPASRARDNSAVDVKILKRRGAWESGVITIQFDDELQRPMPDFTEMQVSRRQADSEAPGETGRTILHEQVLQ